jgi:hypothetical protein
VMKGRVLLGLLAAVGVFAAGWFAHDAFQTPKPAKDLTALDVGGARAPLWATLEPCREPNAIEQRHPPGFAMGIGAMLSQ